MTVTTEDIKTAKQHIKSIYARLAILNRVFYAIGYINGRLVSGNISIASSSNAQRTASITLQVDEADIRLATEIAMSDYIKLSLAIENNQTSISRWYDEGYFIVKSSGVKIDPASSTVSVELSDMMIDLTGERKGAIHAFTSIVKNSQTIKSVIENVLSLSNVPAYSVCDIRLLSEIDSAFDSAEAEEQANLIPYDMDFSVGMSAYDIIEKCVNLYPYYEMGFDVEGIFYVRRSVADQDASLVVLDAFTLDGMVIEESTSIDWSEVKNIVEVWGKDGISYGEAYDVTPDSPFNTFSEEPRRLVITGNEYGVNTDNIYDRFKDTQKAVDIQTRRAELENEIDELSMLTNPTAAEIAKLASDKQKLAQVMREYKQNISVSGNELADQWSEWLLYKKARLNDKITLKTLFMPFLNDVNFKISYRSKSDGVLKTYKVTSVSHDISGGTTTLECARFYNEQVTAYKDMLGTPVITSCTADYMNLTVTVNTVQYAQTYILYIDGKPAARSTSTTISVTLGDSWAGTHYVSIKASASEYRDSEFSASQTVTLEVVPTDDLLITEIGDLIATENGDNIIVGEVI